ncbi:MAG: PQQ-binding-like beta-propeller repeat protein [Planctomycetales bacterium]
MRIWMACLLIGFGTLAPQAVAGEADRPTTSPSIWPQWRGPHRDSQVEAAPWPASLAGDALQKTWRVPLGPSYSGPIVSKDTVFVTETKDAAQEVVRALDRKTGQQRWEASWEGAMSVPFFAKANGDWIRATPAFDGENLFVAGMRDLLVCLDPATGKVRWRVDFVKQMGTPLPPFGFVSSPLVDGEWLYVQAGGALCKLEKATGKIVWKSLDDSGGMNGSAFSSPCLAQVAGRRQLLVQTREKLAGVDPDAGQVLWSQMIPTFRGMNILTPTVSGDTVFTSAYGGKSWLFTIQQGSKGFAPGETWTNKVSGYMSSPVIVGNHIYLHLQNQRVTCIDLATGASRWTTQPFGKYWSLVANGDRILALDERGELRLIQSSPQKFDQLDLRKISTDPTWAHLAVCGDEVFVRELNAMAVYRWR